ncbi:Cellulose binding elicitor lectin (CBEL) [Phytophthora palmivora]|uniref:Cellulose binding elicitor lectin (CBEL) n=1 Tax=Phytophthora palmivora TaxID=4796 RepID=A0A2P4XL73_9STRA|nr:Cellulose binding elicitor lectin (CBEL) [Phytophthora palmivora]
MIARITIAFAGLAAVASAACSTAPFGNCGSDAAGVSCCPSSQYCQPWNTNYYQCLALPATCNQQFPNVDFYGNDIQTIYGIQPGDGTGTRQTSVGAVSGILTGTSTTPTPTPTSTPTPPPTTCTTPAYGSCGSSNGATCCPSGYYCQPWNDSFYQCIQPPAKCSKQLTDKDYYGNDIKTVYVSLPSLCCDACASTAGCKAYTYINNNPGQPVCYLKSAAGTATTKVGAVSGTLN